MKINLQGKNIELTPAIKDHVFKKVGDLEKLLSAIEGQEGETFVNFEVGKSTNHHKSGDVFHSDCLIKANGEEFYASADGEDLYQVIDQVKDSLFVRIESMKDKEQTLFTRGARSVKKMLKGLSKRNPFTSKY